MRAEGTRRGTRARSGWLLSGFALTASWLAGAPRAGAQVNVPAQSAIAPAPAAQAIAPPAPEPGRARDAGWIGAGMAFGVLNMPKLGVGVEVVGELHPRRFWPLAFGLTYWFDNESALGDDALDLGVHPLVSLAFPAGGSRLSVRAYQASAATCPYELGLASGTLELCAGVEGGLIQVTSTGFIEEDDQLRPQFAFDGYARWHFRLGASGIGITYSLGLFVPVLRDRFGYRGRSGDFHEQFQVAPVGGRLDLALAYGF
jgi:hypothetical protein